MRFDGMVEGLRRVCRDRRESLIVATGTEDRSPDAILAYADEVSERVGIEDVDVFFAEYVSPEEDLDTILGEDGALRTIESLKDQGRTRYVGASVHDRPLAERLVASGRVDVVMHRYNMAHRKSESNLLSTALDSQVPVVAFTCTRWGSLLQGHSEWTRRVPTPVDCYRFALSHPAVQVAMTAPSTVAELDVNLGVLQEDAPLADGVLTEWRVYGDLVYGQGMDAFETRWP